MTDLFAVIGNPIKHSRSPQIHQAFAKQAGLAVQYDRLLGDSEAFEPQLKDWFNQYTGFNITVPFKHRAFDLCDQLSNRAKVAGAVNTLWKKGDQIHGDNTDGIGLVNDLTQNLGWEIKGRQVLLIGAGGASAGVLAPLLDKAPRRLILANRTLAKAQALIDSVSANYPMIELEATSLDELPEQNDLVINGTSASLTGEGLALDKRVFGTNCVAYDLMYGTESTPFMRQCEANSVPSADGWGMLVEQAAEAFRIWTGYSADTQRVIQTLRP